MPPETLLVLILRDGKKLIPNGRITILPGDEIILSGKAIGHIDGVNLYERIIDSGDEWLDRRISQINSGDDLIIMIQRGRSIIIPRGDDKIREGDVLVINDSAHVAAEWEESDELI